MTIALPTPFADVEIQASMDRRHRSLHWFLNEPGRLFRNDYVMAWVEVQEREPWRGEPLWLMGYRRRTDSNDPRESFTDPARAAISAALLPPIARYGFSRLWAERMQVKVAQNARLMAPDAQRVAKWFALSDDLTAMFAEGLVELLPVRRAMYGRHRQVRVMDGWTARCWQEVVAEAMVNGQRVGWFTSDGQLVPDDDLIADL